MIVLTPFFYYQFLNFGLKPFIMRILLIPNLIRYVVYLDIIFCRYSSLNPESFRDVIARLSLRFLPRLSTKSKSIYTTPLIRFGIILSFAFFLFACNSTTKQKTDSKFKIYEGTYIYMADANIFESCDKQIKMTVDGEGYLKLESQYLKTVDGGETAYVRLKGYEDMVMSMEGRKKVKAIMVTEVLEVSKENKCE